MLHHLAPACHVGLTSDQTVGLVLAQKSPRRRWMKTNLHHSPAFLDDQLSFFLV